MSDITKHQAEVDKLYPQLTAIKSEMAKVIIGQTQLIDSLLIALLTRGHILLEGVPGLAKTTAISTLAKVVKLSFQRIQFTPDLLPSDLIGSRIYNPKTMQFDVKTGPIFANFILADEINRSPAKVQSALLEAMQEHQVTIGDQTFDIPQPFVVLATQNPIEQEGTYPLPEAQVDRFLLKTVISYPTREQERQIIELAEKTTFKPMTVASLISHTHLKNLQHATAKIYIDDSIKQYITDLVFASRQPHQTKIKDFDKLVAYGASPRGSIGLLHAVKAVALLNQRAYVIPEDIKSIAMDVLRHRIIPTYEAQAEGLTSDHLVQQILDNVPVP